MQSQYKLFKQEKHPIEVDETYHIFLAQTFLMLFSGILFLKI